MKYIILVYPPDCREVNEPYLYTAELASYLNENHLNSFQYDANIEFNKYIYTENGFNDIYDYGKVIYLKIKEKEEIDANDKAILHKIGWLVLVPKEKIYPLLLEAYQGIKTNEGYFKFGNYFRNKRILNNYISAIQYMSKYYTNMNLYNDITDIETILEKGSPYDTYLKEILAKKIIEEKPILVDLFVSSCGQLVPALILGNILKQHGIHVVISDFLTTILRKDLPMQQKIFDYIDGAIVYEQEKAVVELCLQLKGKRLFKEVPNYIYCENSSVLCNDIAEPIELDDLPAPTYDDINFKDYLVSSPAIPYETSRGCHWGKCKFCNLHKGTSKYTRKSAKKVVDDLFALKERYKINTFLIFDNMLELDHLIELSKYMIERKLDINWTVITKITRKITLKEAQIIRKAGCKMIEFEVESMNEKSHKDMDTGVDCENLLESLRNTKKSGIINTVCVLYGMLGENVNDFYATNDIVIQNKDIIDAIITFSMNIAKDSILYNNLSEYNIKLNLNETSLLGAYDRYTGPNVLDVMERDQGVADIFNKSYQEYPVFLCSYMPLIHYANYYQCNDPIQIVRMSDNREKTEDNVPKMDKYIMKVSSFYDFTSNKVIRDGEGDFLLNVLNNEFMLCGSKFLDIEKYIDGISTESTILDKISEEKNMNRNIAVLMYLPILKKYKKFTS